MFSNTKERLTSHARGDTDLAEIIDSHLNDGWLLDYRVWVFDTKEEAQETERRLFERNNDPDKYGWNAIHPWHRFDIAIYDIKNRTKVLTRLA